MAHPLHVSASATPTEPVDENDPVACVMADIDRMVEARIQRNASDPLWGAWSFWCERERGARDRIRERVNALAARIHPYRG